MTLLIGTLLRVAVCQIPYNEYDYAVKRVIVLLACLSGMFGFIRMPRFIRRFIRRRTARMPVNRALELK